MFEEEEEDASNASGDIPKSPSSSGHGKASPVAQSTSDLEGDAFQAERMKEFEEEEEEEQPAENGALPASETKPSSEPPPETTQRAQQHLRENVEGKRWSDGGYAYGFDCTKRRWDSMLAHTSGRPSISARALPKINDSGGEGGKGSRMNQSSFDYNFMTTGHLCAAAGVI